MFLLIMKAIFWKWMLWFAHEFLMVFEAFDQWPLILREGKSKVKNVSLSLFCTATLTSNHLAIKLTIVRTCIVLCKVCSLYTTFMYISPKQQCPHFLVDMVWILIGKIESNPVVQCINSKQFFLWVGFCWGLVIFENVYIPLGEHCPYFWLIAPNIVLG